MEVPILKIPFTENDADFICSELKEMLLAGQLAMGRHNLAFEREFANFCGVRHSLGCANGTAALELICRALELEGASVAVPANTFMATALAPLAAGARIILVDCDPEYFQMCPKDLARKIRPDTKAVILTHIGGIVSPAWREIKNITENNQAVFIEDAAHAHGAEVKEGRAGSLGLAAAFSFFPTKVLTTAEGGMVSTSDDDLLKIMAAIRQHGQFQPGSNRHEIFGLNYRSSEIHALLGLVMMKKVDWILERRRTAAAYYDQLLQDAAPLKPVLAPSGQKPAYYKYMALLPENIDRTLLKKRLKEEHGISLAGEVYAVPGHRQPLWSAHPEYLAAPLEALPNTEMAAERQICLPLYPDISFEQQQYVVERLMEIVRESW